MARLNQLHLLAGGRGERGTILILVLMIALGLVSVTLYFANSMVLEYRGAGNDTASLAAGQAVDGARRYLCSMLKTQFQQTPGQMPDPSTYQAEEVPVGDDARFWLIGRDPNATVPPDQPVFGLVDEASKINLNLLAANTLAANALTTDSFETMLQGLPGMTADMTASIVSWSASADAAEASTDSTYYSQQDPPYKTKNAQFESPDELRLVKGFTWDLLYGRDANRNGLLEANENDAAPSSSGRGNTGRSANIVSDVKQDFGFLEYLTVWSREPNKQSDGTTRTLISDAQGLRTLLSNNLSPTRAAQIMQKFQAAGTLNRIKSVMEFYIKSGDMTADELAKVEDALSVTTAPFIVGRINVNTATQAVLDCVPGLSGTGYPSQLVAARRGKTPDALASIAWVGDILRQDSTVASTAGPFLTTHSYQFAADVVALGYHDRGLRRDLMIIDTADGDPRVIYRRDLGRLGWPLGQGLREDLRLASQQ